MLLGYFGIASLPINIVINFTNCFGFLKLSILNSEITTWEKNPVYSDYPCFDFFFSFLIVDHICYDG